MIYSWRTTSNNEIGIDTSTSSSQRSVMYTFRKIFIHKNYKKNKLYKCFPFLQNEKYLIISYFLYTLFVSMRTEKQLFQMTMHR